MRNRMLNNPCWNQPKGSTLQALRNHRKIDYRCEAVKTGDNVTNVYLYGDIVDEQPIDWWTGEPIEGEWIFPENVRDIFNGITTANVDLHLNTYGGSVFAGIAIANYLREHSANVTAYVDGIAASAGSIVASACDKVVMYDNSMMMIHRASSMAYGNAEELEKEVETLKTIDKAVLASYSRFYGDFDELEALVKAETWFTASDALDCGLCDEIAYRGKSEEGEGEGVEQPEPTNEQPTNEQPANEQPATQAQAQLIPNWIVNLMALQNK